MRSIYRSMAMAPMIVVMACSPQESEQTAATDDAASAAPAADVASVRQAIDAANATLIAAYKAGDAKAALALYAPGGSIMAPNSPAMAGEAGISQGLQGMFSQMTVQEFTLTTTDVEVAGDLAVETGTYTMTYTPKGGTAMSDKGKYLAVFKRQPDGSWKFLRDIWNSDDPMPAGH